MGVDSENTVMVRVCKDELMGNQRVGGETWGIVRIWVITVGNVREYVYEVKPGSLSHYAGVNSEDILDCKVKGWSRFFRRKQG